MVDLGAGHSAFVLGGGGPSVRTNRFLAADGDPPPGMST